MSSALASVTFPLTTGVSPFGTPRAKGPRADSPDDCTGIDGGGSDTLSRGNVETIDIARFRSGDPAAFCTVVEQCGPLIRSIVASYVRDPDDRDDLYQEICIRVWEYRAQFSGRGSLAGWINTIAQRSCYNWMKARKTRESRERQYSEDATVRADAAQLLEDPSQLAAWTDFVSQLRQSLAALPSRQADTFILVHVRGFTAKEAARTLGIRRATVRSNLRHAIKKLRHSMGDYENGLS